MAMDPMTLLIVQAERRLIHCETSLIEPRWASGKLWAQERVGRQQLKAGRLDAIIAEVRGRTGAALDRREVQRRMQAADAYPTVAHLRAATRVHRTWTALVEARFPICGPLVADPPETPQLELPGLTSDLLYSTYGGVPAHRVPLSVVRARHVRDAAHAARAVQALDVLSQAVGGDESVTVGAALLALVSNPQAVLPARMLSLVS